MIQPVASPRKTRPGKTRKAGLKPSSPRRPAPAQALLDWYDAQRRDLPWRAPPGVRPDPYAVWLSEIMLQQTTVATVQGYYRNFLMRWPTVAALAAAPLADVLAAWAGLGYYARARNLHACAVCIAHDHGGRFPQEESALLHLPGVGPYTAAAIAAIAFDRSCVAVDGNVERVMARLHMIETPPRQARALVREKAQAMLPSSRAGDFAQALMDLGATVCTPRAPSCDECPLATFCQARRADAQELYPIREKKNKKPHRHGAIFILQNDGRVFVQQRPSRGLFGGMNAFPATPFTQDIAPSAQMNHVPCTARWRATATVAHVFTHFSLEATVFVASIGARHAFLRASTPGRWIADDRLADEGLPTLMRKAASAAGLIGD